MSLNFTKGEAVNLNVWAKYNEFTMDPKSVKIQQLTPEIFEGISLVDMKNADIAKENAALETGDDVVIDFTHGG